MSADTKGGAFFSYWFTTFIETGYFRRHSLVNVNLSSFPIQCTLSLSKSRVYDVLPIIIF